MKRLPIYLLLLVLALSVPVRGNDVGKLRPVQAIAFYKDGSQFVLETDTDDLGRGNTPIEALEDLKQTTPAIIYLDTAEYLILTDETLRPVEELRGKLKKNVKVCETIQIVNPKDAAAYLRVHQNLPRLKKWKYPEKLPILEQNGKRIKILNNYENNP